MTAETSIEPLLERARAGHAGALARLLTLAEAEHPRLAELAGRRPGGAGRTIGITGSPGVGKSTLANLLIGRMRRRGERVGVLAIDPSSPFSSGAVLADRIRMRQHVLDKDVFIRSVACRSHVGGLGPGTALSIRLLLFAGMDTVLVETVGTGQNEVDVMRVVETVTVVLGPGSGDSMQMMKSGVLEIGDVFVVNKSDQPGARSLVRELRSWQAPRDGWKSPVVLASGLKGDGVEDWVGALDRHGAHVRERNREGPSRP